MININYSIDVSNWYVKKWKNDTKLYNDCDDLMKHIPWKTPGVYYIYRETELLYVGCTVNFRQRLAEHLVVNSNTKDFINTATRIECESIEDRDIREKTEYKKIVELTPKHNKQLPFLKKEEENEKR